MLWHAEVSQLLSLVTTLICFAALSSTLELFYLAGKGEFSRGGTWDWQILRCAAMPRSRWFDPFVKGAHSFTALLLARSSAAFLLASVGIHCALAPALLLVLVVCQVLLNNRVIWGDDGSDQMISLILMALFIYSATGSRADVQVATILFIAAQVTLAYVTAGIAKLAGPEWRRGVAFRNIMGHHTYGSRFVYEMLGNFPLMSRLTSYALILFMVTFPVYFLLPRPWSMIYLVIGITFHLGISIAMRLNGFLTAFLSGYPALFAAHPLIHDILVRNWRS
jgi:hypothetical protein